MIWDSDSECQHVWGDEIIKRGITGGKDNPFAEKLKIKGVENYQETPDSSSQFCQLCGAWRGSYGLEPGIDMYVDHAVQICREIRRVLRKHGRKSIMIELSKPYIDDIGIPRIVKATRQRGPWT